MKREVETDDLWTTSRKIRARVRSGNHPNLAGAKVILWAETVSRFYLPPETLDYITDFLDDKPEIFNECSLVSKSWVPRARKYLPAKIMFLSIRAFSRVAGADNPR